MSCSSMRHRFKKEKQRGLTFKTAMEIFQNVEGSVAAHKNELKELRQSNANPEEIRHLQEHISDGERLLREISSMRLH
ncbi:hypothetical protein [Calderihabitans maritimus]|uniref:Uncharacterized protein n=1 Tax=Calderihabitans maritimus TaxID=1246530 RepID=A0A1Z5HSJ7_9FIRM|nr:hypothetical protein [Calderihabitans maritimus]GAW92494.1 hypothetical protein Desku_2228 [Calderihabitans maritimus]